MICEPDPPTTSPPGLAADSCEYEPRRPLEDAVVRHKRDVEAQSGGCDPPIGVVLALAEGVTNPLARDAEFDVGADEIGAGLHDLGTGNGRFEMLESSGSPASEKRAVADLGDGLEREDFEAAEEERFVAPSKRRVGDETGAVDVGIDDDGASGCPAGQLRTASRKASASSLVRSSITISP